MKLQRPTLPPLILLAITLAGPGLLRLTGVAWNATPSVPRGFYRLVTAPIDGHDDGERQAFQPGDLVAVCLPADVAAEGHDRGYLPNGRCPGDVAPVLKRVGAVGGQVVEIDGTVRVDGAFLQPAAPRRDRAGRTLEPLPPGRHRLRPGELWLATDHPRSWDSRYYGPVDADAVLGTVRPLWTSEHRLFPREKHSGESTP